MGFGSAFESLDRESRNVNIRPMKLHPWAGLILVILWADPSLGGGLSDASSSPACPILQRIRKQYDLPALAAVVVKDGQIRDRAAVGIRKMGDPTPVTTNDLFHIGSCTKSMTAMLAAILIEKGILGWDTTIAEVFPELKEKMNPQYERVTLEQLLQHRGGVPATPPGAAWSRAWQQQGTPAEQRYEFIQAVLSQAPETTPGSKCVYSNQGYAIAGAMLEKLAGKPWETLMKERLFLPLGMKSAGFGPPGTKDQVDQPWGHAGAKDRLTPIQGDNPPAISPGGGVHCSLDDLAAYTRCHLEGEKRGGLLKPETFRKLHTPPAGEEYACGWIRVDRGWAGGKALTHAGSNTLWYLVMWLAPEKDFSVVVGTNAGGDKAAKACDKAAGALIQKWLTREEENSI